MAVESSKGRDDDSLPSVDRRPRVLVVEDEAELRRALDRALRARGLRVTQATSCTSALATDGTFACGVFDILLPDGNGLEVATALLERGRVERAVFYSATTDERLWLRARSGGTFIHKNEGIATLVEQVLAELA